MKEIRNPELKRELTAYAVIAAAFAITGFITGPFCAFLLLAAGIAFCLAHLYFARKRYREMEELAQRIDRILHGHGTVLINESDEGELAILTSEIHKMTVRLKEQSDLLIAEQLRLTEAIQDIFHQIRTPLTSMNLVGSLLGEEDLSYERRIRLTHELKRQLGRTQWLVETLLKLSKIDAGTVVFLKETHSVKVLVEKAVEPFSIPMELRGQALQISVSDERFMGDLQWTTEALSNIIKNSMEHTPFGGEIKIKADETALYTEIIIEDNGPGFENADVPHLFERFYKGKGASEGSIGIGLALSRGIIAAQNGTITASNGLSGGARFVIRFYKSVI